MITQQQLVDDWESMVNYLKQAQPEMNYGSIWRVAALLIIAEVLGNAVGQSPPGELQ